ncbi:nuclear transport factor 2 family protein [Algoriphagus aestuariicola]|uniref:Nuclear transport factor 2 family protein n=1 Tax=Algoriphagus aestuariicola TaxID=1852016 RepID=A0ABS3BVP4_9BACT|nr:nuclear transport factor 2 family protein [Algoriphagus aestuariicola]MBN7803353.1 nuclear transport factor 2 family protein [Algoriphagus aestuariicola]
MKRILFILLFLSCQFAFGQAEKEVDAAVKKMQAAFLAEDVATLRTLTSEDLSYGHSSGTVENQEQFLAVFESKVTDYQKWDISDQTISLHGKYIALVRHNIYAEFAENGKVNSLKLGLLMVWVKEKGGWKLLARQAFRTPAA